MVRRLGIPSKGAAPSNDKSKVSYRLPTKMKQDLALRVVYDDYGMRGKSRWISEAITDFLQDPSWKAQVIDADMVGGNDAHDVLHAEPDTYSELLSATKQAESYWREEIDRGNRQDNPDTVEVSVAAIVRAAIQWRYFDLRMPVIPDPQKEMDL